MNFMQIEYFVVLAEVLNFSKAAERLYISQPVLSKRILTLEKELGFSLFVRDTHKVALTSAGAKMYSFFRRFLNEYSQIRAEALTLHDEESGNLVIGLVDYLEDIGIDIPFVLARFRETFPETTLKIFQQPYHFWPEEILDGGIRLGFTFNDLVEGRNDLEFYPLVECSMNVCYSAYHKLAEKECISAADFVNEKIYLPTSQNNKLPEKRLAKYIEGFGLDPRNLVFIPTLSAVFANMGNGQGVALFDDPIVKQQKVYQIKSFPLKRHTLGIAHKKGIKDDRIRFLCNIICAGFEQDKSL